MTASEPLKADPAAGPRGALARNWRDVVLVGVLAAAAGKVAYDRSGDKEALTNPSVQSATLAPAPKLSVAGEARANKTLWYTCWNLKPGEQATVVVGAANNMKVTPHGVLVPQPQLVFGRRVGSYGTINFPLRLPKVLPQGIQGVWAQVWSSAWRGSNATHSVVP